MKRLVLLAAAAVIYLFAAWTVTPGFYDGFSPQQPYNWTCPPAQAGANSTPSSGHADVPVTGGSTEAYSAYTRDAQIVIGFLPDALDAAGKTAVSVDIMPLATCPQPKGIRFVTNVYRITSDATLKKKSNVTLLYSNLEPPPEDIYRADDPQGPWAPIERSQQGQVYTIFGSTDKLGYFAAGYKTSAPAPGAVTVGGGQTLPIIVAVLIVIVVLAGLPMAVLRRRRSSGADEEDEA